MQRSFKHNEVLLVLYSGSDVTTLRFHCNLIKIPKVLTMTDFTSHLICCFTKLLHTKLMFLLKHFTVLL